jgi:hypothetical protein
LGDRIAAARRSLIEAGAQSIRLEVSEDRTVSFEVFGKGRKLVILRGDPLGFDVFRRVDDSNDLQEHLDSAIAYLTDEPQGEWRAQ